MAIGIVVNGLGTVVMLAIASHTFTVDEFAVYGTWWMAATLVSFPIGVFEVLLARALVAELAAGEQRASTETIAGRSVLIVGPVAVALALADPWLADLLFEGRGGVGALLALFLVASLVQALQRGHATGSDRFGMVAVLLALDGLLRAIAIGAVVLGGSDRAAVGALAVCVASLATGLIGHLRMRGWIRGLRLRNPAVSTSTALLLIAGAAGPILINNASVPWLAAHGTSALIVGSFSGVLALSRVPTQIGGAVYGPLLNQLSHAIERGDDADQHRLYRRSLTTALITGIAFVVAFGVAGNLAVDLFIGSEYGLETWTLLTLAASSAMMLVSIVAQVRAAALEQWNGIAASWLIAAAGFVVVLVLPLAAVTRAALAPMIASAIGLLALTITGARSARSRR